MSPIILIVLVLVIFACAFGYMTYRDAQRQAREKKRNQYHDRV
jgi:preprotein translocase subunit YajC